MGKNTNMNWATLLVVLGSFTLCLFTPCSTATATPEPLNGVIKGMRGGLGVTATIDNYQLAWGNRDVHWVLEIRGGFVLFGVTSGTVSAMGLGLVRSSLFPPAIGFGPVTVTLTVTADGATLASLTRSGFMIGPIVLLL